MGIHVQLRTGGDTLVDFDLPHVDVSVGRSRYADVYVPGRDVSRRQCRLLLRGKRIMVLDDESQGGTYVNGRRLDEPRILLDSDEVGFGSNVMRTSTSPAVPVPWRLHDAPPEATPYTRWTAVAPRRGDAALAYDAARPQEGLFRQTFIREGPLPVVEALRRTTGAHQGVQHEGLIPLVEIVRHEDWVLCTPEPLGLPLRFVWAALFSDRPNFPRTIAEGIFAQVRETCDALADFLRALPGFVLSDADIHLTAEGKALIRVDHASMSDAYTRGIPRPEFDPVVAINGLRASVPLEDEGARTTPASASDIAGFLDAALGSQLAQLRAMEDQLAILEPVAWALNR